MRVKIGRFVAANDRRACLIAAPVLTGLASSGGTGGITGSCSRTVSLPAAAVQWGYPTREFSRAIAAAG